MEFKFFKVAMTGLTFFVGGFVNLANAGLITSSLGNLSSLTADYNQTAIGSFSSFNAASFGALNGTGTTSDASNDSATFKLSLTNLSAFTGTTDQYLFESGGESHGIGIVYQSGNLITFAQRTVNPLNTLSLDVTTMIGQDFDIVASLSLDGNFMRLFVGENLFGELAIGMSSNDWAGSSGSAFGQGNSNLVMNAAGVDFASGGLSDFNYYHDIVVDASVVPEPSTLAIFALGMLSLASRRFKK